MRPGWTNGKSAAEARAIGRRCLELASAGQARSWAGEPVDEVEIASLARVHWYLESAAHGLTGQPWPPARIWWLLPGCLAEVAVVVLVLVALDPSRPVSVLAALTAGLVTGLVYARAVRLVERVARIGGSTTKMDAGPSAADLRDRLVGLAQALDDPGRPGRREPAEEARIAGLWLARAIEIR